MVKILDHPIIKIKLTTLRDKNTTHTLFDKVLNEIASLMVYEIFRDYEGKSKTVTTPMDIKTTGLAFDKEIVLVPILRAGLGMIKGFQYIVPEARVGHIGIYRDDETHEAHNYYYKMPNVSKDSLVFVVDPMLATGGSADDAITHLKKDGFTNIKLVCLVGAPEGVTKIREQHPNVKIYLAAQDEKLDDNKYIVPGLGDAGDRIFGTK